MADLISVAEAQAALPSLTAAQVATLPFVIAAASRAVERFCDRPLALADFDRTYHPDRSRTVRLGPYPVRSVARVAAGAIPALSVTNAGDPAATRATVEVVTTGEPPDLAAVGVTLRLTASGVAAPPVTLTFASYPTVDLLAAAVATQGSGWSATTQNGRGGSASADLMADPGARYCGGSVPAYAWADAGEVTDYELDAARGVLTIGAGWPFVAGGAAWGLDVYRYPDRMWGAAPRFGSVRVRFTAGYATIPDDVKAAAILTVKSLLDLTPFPGSFMLERTTDYTYSQSPSVSLVPAPAKMLLAPYRRMSAV